jgi:RNA recognition motif-containing protein
MSESVNKIFVGGIPQKSTKFEVAELFSRYGHVITVILPQSSSGTNKGFAFVSFPDIGPILKIFADLKNIVLRAKLVS